MAKKADGGWEIIPYRLAEWNADDADFADGRGLSLNQIREDPPDPRHPRSIPGFVLYCWRSDI